MIGDDDLELRWANTAALDQDRAVVRDEAAMVVLYHRTLREGGGPGSPGGATHAGMAAPPRLLRHLLPGS